MARDEQIDIVIRIFTHRFITSGVPLADFQHATDGIELDFTASPGGAPHFLKSEDVEEYTPVLTDYMRRIAAMTRSGSEGKKLLGVRVYPTEEINRSRGLDVRQWLEEGLVDYVVGLLYIDFKLDPDMPIDWLIEAAHAADISVYGMLQPYVRDENSGSPDQVYAPTAATRRRQPITGPRG